jgi:glycosyltransferase involved in cell wall biosynthesis
VLAQDTSDWELVIIDDASTDNSPQVIRQYRDPRVTVRFNAVNKGLFATLNLAIASSRGRFIRLWSQDDIMLPHCLGTEHRFLEEHPETGMI